MNRRVRLAAYLAHTRRADGSWAADWTVVRLAIREGRQVLRQHLTHISFSQGLMEAAHAASEDLRTNASATANWPEVRAQILRVLPVVQRVLRTLHDLKKAE